MRQSLAGPSLLQKFVSEIFNFTFVWQTFDEDAESEVFSEVGVPEVRFFFIFSSSAGGRVIKSRYLEAKPLKFSPPKSLCGTVGSPWVSPATLFGFWETLIKFSESMILYGE